MNTMLILKSIPFLTLLCMSAGQKKYFIGDCSFGFCDQLCKSVSEDSIECFCKKGFILRNDGRKCDLDQDDTQLIESVQLSGDGESPTNCDDSDGNCDPTTNDLGSGENDDLPLITTEKSSQVALILTSIFHNEERIEQESSELNFDDNTSVTLISTFLNKNATALNVVKSTIFSAFQSEKLLPTNTSKSTPPLSSIDAYATSQNSDVFKVMDQRKSSFQTSISGTSAKTSQINLLKASKSLTTVLKQNDSSTTNIYSISKPNLQVNATEMDQGSFYRSLSDSNFSYSKPSTEYSKQAHNLNELNPTNKTNLTKQSVNISHLFLQNITPSFLQNIITPSYHKAYVNAITKKTPTLSQKSSTISHFFQKKIAFFTIDDSVSATFETSTQNVQKKTQFEITDSVYNYSRFSSFGVNHSASHDRAIITPTMVLNTEPLILHYMNGYFSSTPSKLNTSKLSPSVMRTLLFSKKNKLKIRYNKSLTLSNFYSSQSKDYIDLLNSVSIAYNNTFKSNYNSKSVRLCMEKHIVIYLLVFAACLRMLTFQTYLA